MKDGGVDPVQSLRQKRPHLLSEVSQTSQQDQGHQVSRLSACLMNLIPNSEGGVGAQAEQGSCFLQGLTFGVWQLRTGD